MLQPKRKFWGRRPGFDTGDIVHVGVNLAFVVVLFVMTRYWNLALLAGVLVVLSKWRTLAVQPRFWLPNIKANLVDIVVGISTVMLLYQSTSDAWAILWSALYGAWLLFIKPRTSDLAVGAQAMWSQFLGLMTIFLTTGLLEASFFGIVLVWLVAWASARHFFGNYEEPHYKTLALVWALLVSQIAWVGFHWLNYYRIDTLDISSAVLIVTVLAGVTGVLYHAHHDEKLQRSKVIENVLFGGALIALILVTSAWTVQL